jgi:hypothetical protein
LSYSFGVAQIELNSDSYSVSGGKQSRFEDGGFHGLETHPSSAEQTLTGIRNNCPGLRMKGAATLSRQEKKSKYQIKHVNNGSSMAASAVKRASMPKPHA